MTLLWFHMDVTGTILCRTTQDQVHQSDHRRHLSVLRQLGWVDDLERRGFSRERIAKIQRAYKILLASKMNTSQALEKLKSEADRGEDVGMLIRFIEAADRGVIK